MIMLIMLTLEGGGVGASTCKCSDNQDGRMSAAALMLATPPRKGCLPMQHPCRPMPAGQAGPSWPASSGQMKKIYTVVPLPYRTVTPARARLDNDPHPTPAGHA